MKGFDFQSVRPAGVISRIAIALAVAGGFLWAASQIDPGASRAVDQTRPESRLPHEIDPFGDERPVDDPGDLEELADQLALSASADAMATGVIGSLEGRDHTIHIHATPDGPRFTITDQAGGVLASRLTAEQVYRRFPEYAGEHTIAGPMMMVDPDY